MTIVHLPGNYSPIMGGLQSEEHMKLSLMITVRPTHWRKGIAVITLGTILKIIMSQVIPNLAIMIIMAEIDHATDRDQ